MLTIYGVTRSRASRIIWLCHEIGLPFRQVPVIQAYRLADPDAPGAPQNTHSASFLKLAPAGSIPVIDDDGLILSESMACNLHLARKHGQPYGPADPAEDALMSQWSFYACTAIETDALTLLFLYRPGKSMSEADRASVEAAAERLARPLAVVADHLAANGHMVGRRFTVADINMAEVIRYAQSYDPLMSRFPAITEWLTDCQARPGFRKMWDARVAEPE